MNLNLKMRKLQQSILLKTGLPVKISQRQFYSQEQNRMITMHSLSVSILQQTENGQKERDYEIISTASQIEALLCLKDIWEQMQGWKHDTDT